MQLAAARERPGGVGARLLRALDAHARRRAGVASGVQHTGHRHIYILPTRFGLLFALLLLALYLGAVNFGSNLTHGLMFLLLAVGLLDMRETHRQLLGLAVDARAGKPVFAGDTLTFCVHIRELRGVARPLLRAHFRRTTLPLEAALGVHDSVEFELPVASHRRGWQAMDAVRLESTYPLGLFRAWCWLAYDCRALVYPRPLASPLPTTGCADSDDGAPPTTPTIRGDAELSHLRDYQRGDAPRHIAWKAMARSDRLLTKAFAAPTPSEVWLDWDAVPAADDETRLAWLAHAVIEAGREARACGLRLPGTRIAPAHGDAHQAACLRALALYGPGDCA